MRILLSCVSLLYFYGLYSFLFFQVRRQGRDQKKVSPALYYRTKLLHMLNKNFVHLFYPTAFKGSKGIVFTHGVQEAGWGRAEKSLSGLYRRSHKG